uniref:Uncharacterized protein n=1 Tax=Arundo donax TaxID=35708 RepID=A0A0A9HIC6_ARUDO
MNLEILIAVLLVVACMNLCILHLSALQSSTCKAFLHVCKNKEFRAQKRNTGP